VLFVEAGYTPMQAIQAATSVNAELLGMSDQIGALKPGMLADVLVVDGNPLERIGLLREPECIKYVFKEGRRAYAA
jgi:imidazolonepropionase-like amidohydrolase